MSAPEPDWEALRAPPPRSPCGRCRQVLWEAGGAELLIDGGAGHAPVRLGELLPGAFGGGDLSRAQ